MVHFYATNLKKFVKHRDIKDFAYFNIHILVYVCIMRFFSFGSAMVSSIVVWMIARQPGRTTTISNREQLESFDLEKNAKGYDLEVSVKDLPAYRELFLYSLSESEKEHTLSLILSTDFNLLLEQNNETLEITWENSFSPEAAKVELIDNEGNIFYTAEFPE